MATDWANYGKLCTEAWDKMIAENEELGEGLHVGKIFRTQVADGYALYKIVKINKATVRIEWVDDEYLNADQWHDQVLGNGGSFPKGVIEGIVCQIDALNRIFSKKR